MDINHKLGYHPAFQWIRQYLNPRGEINDDRIELDRMAFAVRSRAKKYMFGVEVPNSVRHALQLDKRTLPRLIN